MGRVVVSGSFDNLQARLLRLLEEAHRLGPLTVLLWSDESIGAIEGERPRFPLAERRYLISSVRFVDEVVVATDLRNREQLSHLEAIQPDIWIVEKAEYSDQKADFCRARGIDLRTVESSKLECYPNFTPLAPCGDPETDRRKVLVTGCFDWLHSGHVRFFEEVSQLGDLYAVIGHDANIRHLKGEGHPLLGQAERRYAVGAVRFVTQALISSGKGWMDAEPEIAVIKPDIYAVNEDGDRPEKRDFCRQRDIEYVVLKRVPRPGLPARSSTDLRGF